MKKYIYKIPSCRMDRGWIWGEGWYNRPEDVKVFHPNAFDIKEMKACD